MKVEANCMYCKHCVLHAQGLDWSDITLGDSAEFRCTKGHWDIPLRPTVEEPSNLRHLLPKNLIKAARCGDYEGAEGET